MNKTKRMLPAYRTCALCLLFTLALPAAASLTLRLDGNDYAQLGNIHFTVADRTVHVVSLPDQQPLLCAPVGTPQGNPGGSLTLRLDSVNYPLSGNVELSRVAGTTLLTATSVEGVLVCNPNANDAVYRHGFE